MNQHLLEIGLFSYDHCSLGKKSGGKDENQKNKEQENLVIDSNRGHVHRVVSTSEYASTGGRSSLRCFKN